MTFLFSEFHSRLTFLFLVLILALYTPVAPMPNLTRRERLKLKKAAKKTTKTGDETSKSLVARAKEIVDAFFDIDFDVKTELKAQRKRMDKNCDDIDWSRIDEVLYMSSKFDSLEWWHVGGRDAHKEVFFVALTIIALPSHNGFQERIFSACTHFDSPLRQSLKIDRFEMAILLAVNECIMKCKIPSDEEAKEIVGRYLEKMGDD